MKKVNTYTAKSLRAEEVGTVPLAFQACDTADPVTLEGDAFAWTPEAIVAFADLWRDAQTRNGRERRNLPYASLRALLETFVEHIRRIDRSVGLNDWGFQHDNSNQAIPFLWTDDHSTESDKSVRAAIDEWLPNYLVESFATPLQIQQRYLDRIYELQELEKLVSVSSQQIQVLPWGWSEETGTAHPNNAQTDFSGLIDFVTRVLAGQRIFPALSPLRRVVVNDSSSGAVELMTDPITMDDKGSFSFVVNLEVVTFPAMHQPLVRIDFSKRRWLQRVADRVYGYDSIGGYAFPAILRDRAPRFKLVRHRTSNNQMLWRPDHAFDALRRRFQLPLLPHDATSICSGSASTEDCTVRLVHRPGLAQQEPKIKGGIPEIDKLEGYETIAAKLSKHGLTPFCSYERVVTHHKSVSNRADVINASTLLGAALEWPELNDDERTLTPEYIRTLKTSDLDQLLRERFQMGLASVQHGEHIANFEDNFGESTADQTADLLALVSENAQAVSRLYGSQRPQLAILHDPQDVVGITLLQAIIRVLWGDAIEVKLQRLPNGVHGPREVLTGSTQSRTERFRLRVDAWKHLAEAIAAHNRTTLCLVMARDFCVDASGKAKPDDSVNKAAGRKALAATAKATVQYLLPPKTDRKGQIQLTEFLYKAQAALKDLISAHAGRIDGVADAVVRCFGTGESAPTEIIGLTIIRRDTGRTHGALEKTFLPVAFKIDVASGQCSVRYAHDSHGRMHISDWRPFSRALGDVAGVSPVLLATNQRERRTRFMQFCETVVTESVDAGAQPVVLVDSTNCATLWPWLKDAQISAGDIEIGERQWMQDNWRGARIVRVRQDLSPGIIIDKVLQLQSSGRKKKKIDLRIPSSPGAGSLYRLTTPDQRKCVTYLSVGGKSLHQHKRGLSCHRAVLLPVRTISTDGKQLVTLQERKPFTDQWPTPNPIEIVVALRQESDDADKIAEFVEALRYGFGHYSEWTALPAPLFFERVLRDYISGFTLADDDDLMIETSIVASATADLTSAMVADRSA